MTHVSITASQESIIFRGESDGGKMKYTIRGKENTNNKSNDNINFIVLEAHEGGNGQIIKNSDK